MCVGCHSNISSGCGFLGQLHQQRSKEVKKFAANFSSYIQVVGHVFSTSTPTYAVLNVMHLYKNLAHKMCFLLHVLISTGCASQQTTTTIRSAITTMLRHSYYAAIRIG